MYNGIENCSPYNITKQDNNCSILNNKGLSDLFPTQIIICSEIYCYQFKPYLVDDNKF